jgi:hypothetical protein
MGKYFHKMQTQTKFPSQTAKMIDELTAYLAEPPVIPIQEKGKPVMFHPLEYWRKNESRFNGNSHHQPTLNGCSALLPIFCP